MKWNKLTIETTTAAEDMLSYELSEMGMEGYLRKTERLCM